MLGIPAVLAIHFLQQESRTVRISTLFMLEALAPESVEGRRFQQLRNSVPLWLQLLSVLLLTWLLVQPRFLTAGSTQRITIVLDSAVAMRAFQPVIAEKLAPRLREISGAAQKTEWLLLETDPTRPALYTGTQLVPMLAAIDKWLPALGKHDPALALRNAISTGDRKGMVIFVTDEQMELPVGVDLFAVGRPISNGGFTGLRITEPDSASPGWQVLVKNFSKEPMKRECTITSANAQPRTLVVELGPGEARPIKGSFPADSPGVELRLNPDEFTFDDTFSIVRPRLKPMALTIQSGTPATTFFQRFAASFLSSRLVAGSEGPDLYLGTAPAADFTPPPPPPAAPAAGGAPAAPKPAPPAAPSRGAGIFMIVGDRTNTNILRDQLLVERSALTQDLRFNGLLPRFTSPIALRPEDQALLWAGNTPLIFRRLEAGKPQLYLNFDVLESQGDQAAALVVLLSRFAETVRAAKIAEQAINADTGQRLFVAAQPGGAGLVVTSSAEGVAPQEFPSTGERTPIRAPLEPGLFTVKQGNTVLVRGAASFSDARELDFTAASTFDGLEGKTAELLKQNTYEDTNQQLWLCLLTALLLANWAWLGRKRTL